ncbi:MAG: division/cell wall cluster transcriptional repressor MraZ [Ruminococcus sp.]|nr:division/cell wall cluster transcriptional repressor MraZ [Ruminococcus sp.]
MKEPLYGTYNPSIDAKGRMSFPNKLRDILGAEFYLCVGHDDNYIAVYSPDEFEKYCDKLRSITGEIGTQLRRELLAGADKQIPDKQGRIFLAQHLRDFAGITDDVTIVGALHKAEIWNTETYKKSRGTVDPDAKRAALDSMML